MKSLTKSFRAKFAAADAQVRLSVPLAEALRDVRSAFFGLSIHAGKSVLSAMMEAERSVLCGPKACLTPCAPQIFVARTSLRERVRMGIRSGIMHPCWERVASPGRMENGRRG